MAALGDLGRLRRLARLLVGDADVADDLVGEAIARTLPRWRLGRVDDGAAYVHRTMVNLAARRWRRRALALRRDHAALGWTAVPAGADDVVVERDRTLRAVLALAPRRRTIVVLRFYEDRSLSDIAGLLGVAEGTVKSQLSPRPRATPRRPRGSGRVVSTDLEHRLRQHLASVDDLPLRDVGPADVAAAGVARVARRRRTAAGVAAAAVVAVGAAGLWAATVDRPDADGPATVPAATAPVPTAAPAPPTTVATAPARWALLAADPRGAVLAPTVTWTGTDAIVVGGRDVDGAPVPTAMAYAPATDTWRAIADPPPLGDEPVAVWTGGEVVVVDAGTTHAYDPDADQWRSAAAPPAAVAASAPSVWTGSELLVWTPGGGPAAYDPAADAWHPLPVPPIESRHDAVSVWTGTEWIVWGGTGSGGGQVGDGAAYDPATATWRLLAAVVADRAAGQRGMDGHRGADRRRLQRWRPGHRQRRLRPRRRRGLRPGDRHVAPDRRRAGPSRLRAGVDGTPPAAVRRRAGPTPTTRPPTAGWTAAAAPGPTPVSAGPPCGPGRRPCSSAVPPPASVVPP